MREGKASGGAIAEGVAEKLREIIAPGHDLNVSQLQFVRSSQIAERFGDDWPAEKKRALSAAHDFIRKRVGQKDLLLRAADGFILVYADPERERTEAHSARLMADLNAYFMERDKTQPAHEMEAEHKQLAANEFLQSVVTMRSVSASDDDDDDEEEETDKPDGIEWRYLPAWDVRGQAITKYFLTPFDRKADRRVPGYRFEEVEPGFDLAEIDTCGLEKSETVLRKMAKRGAQCLVGTSIHVATMSKPASRSRLLRVLDDLDPELARYRVLQLSAVPAGFPRMHLQEIVDALKARAPTVSISVGWAETDIRSLLKLSPASIGFAFSAAELGADSNLSKDQICGLVAKAADAARGANVRFFFDGCADKPLVVKLRAARVDVISSETVWPFVPEPRGVEMWPSQRLAA